MPKLALASPNSRKLLSALVGLQVIFFAQTGMGIEASEAEDQTARLTLNSLAVQGPALDRSTRGGFALEYLVPIAPGLRVGALAQFATDSDEARTKRLNVTEDYYWFGPSLELSYPFLFRYAIQLTPTYVLSTTEITLDNQSENVSKWQLGALALGRLQYTVHPVVEAGLVGGLHMRFSDDKVDWLYGIEVAINITAFGKSGGSSSQSFNRRRG